MQFEFKEIKSMSDKELLENAKRIYMMANEGLVDELLETWFIDEVSHRKYGYDDVMSS